MEEDVRLEERSQTGIIRHASAVYGESHDGRPLTVWLPEEEKPTVLVLASMHGDESETTVVLSDALRSIRVESLKNAAILCMGCALTVITQIMDSVVTYINEDSK